MAKNNDYTQMKLGSENKIKKENIELDKSKLKEDEMETKEEIQIKTEEEIKIQKEKEEKEIEEDEKITEQKDYTIISNSNITQYKTDLVFKTIIEFFDEKMYVIPKYQRNFIWKKEQVENLVISMIRGFPIPPIYVYKNDANQRVILDGQQRILSLFLYYIGKYFKNESNIQADMHDILNEETPLKAGETMTELFIKIFASKLKDVDYIMKEKEQDVDITYSRLTIESKRNVDLSALTIIEINVNDTKYKNRVLYKVFENLNSGGTLLKNQELRNGIYQCEFYEALHKINSDNEKWKNIWGKKHKNYRDVELLLRFCAVDYYFKIEDNIIKIKPYEGSYPTFCNDFSDVAMGFKTEEIEKYKKKIEKFVEKIKTTFRIPNLLLECLFFAVNKIEGDYFIYDDLVKKIKNQKDYLENSEKNTANKKNVEGRFLYVYKELSKYVDENSDKNK